MAGMSDQTHTSEQRPPRAAASDLAIELVGISRDLAGALNAFKESVGAENLFVSDPGMEVIHAYGAEMPNRGVAARYYFLIDEEGKIAWKNTTGQLIPTERLIEELRSL